jgi:hypothetical protein
MLNVAIAVFAIAAVGGLILALHVLRAKFAPWPLSVLHALLGAAGLVLLALAVLREGAGSLATWSLGLFVVAALGGFFLASFHVKQKLPPKAVVVVHAGVAIVAFALLLVVFVGA